MLESIRKRQQGLMIAVAAIIIISFAYLYNRLDLGSPTGQIYAFSIEGRKIRYDDAQRIAKAALVVSEDLSRPELIQGLGAADVAGLVQNILILHRQAKELGIEANQDEIEAVIRNVPRFRANGRYDPQSFKTYLTEEVERRSIPRKLFYQSVADSILYEKLHAVVTAGLVPTPVEIDLTYQRQYETLAASVVTLKRDDFASGIGISQEEIQTYYDTHKDSLRSPERRQIEYVFLEQPKHPRILRQEQERAKAETSTAAPQPEPAPVEPAPGPVSVEPAPEPAAEDPEPEPISNDCGGQAEPVESAGAPGLTDPSDGILSFDPIPGSDEPPPSEPGSLLDPNITLEPTPSEEDLNAQRAQEQKENEEFQQQLKEFQIRVGDFADAVANPPEGAGVSSHFRDLAAQEGFEVKTPPPFTREDAPAELTTARDLLPEVFRRDLDDPMSDAIRGLGGYYVFHLLKVEEPQSLTLETAQEQIRDALIQERSEERMREAALEHRKALLAAIAEGADFTSAASARQLAARDIPNFTASKPPTAESHSAQIVDAASLTPEGSISEPVEIPEGMLLVHVRERIPAPATSDPASPPPSPPQPPAPGLPPGPAETPEQQRESIAMYLETSGRFLAFRTWLDHQRENARIVVPAGASPIRLN
ncbi:MAG TPA: peptidyl-prolyl cis-trans isomerase [Verrucomicrobiales bacterium]|nr:peptidyl-prolyl cis-trans isomerase [Verrucomicrobiales bacterium]